MQMHRVDGLAQIVGKSLQLQGGATADQEIVAEQGLQRDDDVLPGQRSTRALVDARRRLRQPAGGDVLVAQSRGVAMPGQPGRIDDQPLGQLLLQSV